jgi:hypothetical protein
MINQPQFIHYDAKTKTSRVLTKSEIAEVFRKAGETFRKFRELREAGKKKMKKFVDKKVKIEALVKTGGNILTPDVIEEKTWVGYIRQGDCFAVADPVFMQSNARKSYYTLAYRPEDVFDGHIFIKSIETLSQ